MSREPSASGPPPATAIKARILKHMNGDHQRELAHYLQHWANLSTSAAHDNPQLIDMTFTHMEVQVGGKKTHRIPISPPMNSWSDARLRAVDMDKTARAALGIDEVQVCEYTIPRGGVQWTVAIVCFATYVSFLTRGLMRPGTWFYDVALTEYWPGGPEWFLWMQTQAFLPMLAIHITEVWYLNKTRLRRYDVVGSTWWKWIASCFVEGFGTFQRVDAIARREKAKRENQKH